MIGKAPRAAFGTGAMGAKDCRTADQPAPGLWVLAVLCLLLAFAAISTDVYLPAMPAMARSLGAGHGEIEYTISGYLGGFAFGQLFWGPVGDRYGRKRPVAAGLVLFVIGAAGCALASSVELLILARVIQALGASAGVVLARAMVRDLYAGDRAARMLSTLMAVMAIAPMIGPLAGGAILLHWGWRAIFVLLVGVGLVALAALFTLPETFPPERRSGEGLGRAFAAYGTLLESRRLLGFAGVGTCYYAGTFAFIAGSPAVYIGYYHVEPQHYGWLFAISIVGIMAANFANVRLVPRFGSERLMRMGGGVAATSGLLVGAVAVTGFGGLQALVAALFIFAGTAGFIIANSIAGALGSYPRQAGAVSAMVGAAQYGGGIAGSGLVGLLADGTPRALGLVIAGSGVGTVLCLLLVVSPAPSRPAA